MNLNRIDQPVTGKGILKLLGIVVLGVGVFFGGRVVWERFDSGPKSPQRVKRDIRKFLISKADRSDFDKPTFDFSLKEGLPALQTNVAQLKEEVSLLQTNATKVAAEATKLRNENRTLAEQERALRTAAKVTDADAGSEARRAGGWRSELAQFQTNAVRAAASLASLQSELAALQATNVALTNEISGLLTNLASLGGAPATIQPATTNLSSAATNQPDAAPAPGSLPALQKQLAAKQGELSAARRQLAEKQKLLASREHVLAKANASLASFQTNVVALLTNAVVAAGGTNAAGASPRDLWLAKQKELAANTEALTARTKEAAALQTQLQTKNKDLLQLERDLRSREQAVGAQTAQFSKDIGKKVGEAATYENIYYLIGQQLWVADKLLASKDPIEQQQALSIALAASGHATASADDSWLAARICEGYLLPNLSLADAKGRTGYTPESLLWQVTPIFDRAGELGNVVRTLRLAAQQGIVAPTRTDALYFSLGYTLERLERFDEALQAYRGVQQSSNYVKRAEQRIEAVHNMKQQAAGK